MNAPTALMTAERNVDDDRTIVVPANASHVSSLGDLSFELDGNGLNPILDAASPLIGLAVRARSLPAHDDVEGLHLLVVNEVKSFEQDLDALGYDRATTLAARYCLCTIVDEAILSTAWGSGGVWSAHSLLSHFHNETWGGEKYFLILARLLQDTSRNRDMIELLYVFLRLGFRGKYAVVDNGQAKLDVLMENIYDALWRLRPEYPEVLSECWSAQPSQPRHLPAWLSIKVVLAGAVVCLVGVFLWFNDQLRTTERPVITALSAIVEESTR